MCYGWIALCRNKFRSDYIALQDRLKTLPNKITHEVMVRKLARCFFTHCTAYDDVVRNWLTQWPVMILLTLQHMMSWENWLAQWQVTTLLIVQHMLVLWESWLTQWPVTIMLVLWENWLTQCQITILGHCTMHDVILEGHCTTHDVIVRKLARSMPNYNFRSLYNAWCNTRSLRHTWCHSKKTGSLNAKLQI